MQRREEREEKVRRLIDDAATRRWRQADRNDPEKWISKIIRKQRYRGYAPKYESPNNSPKIKYLDAFATVLSTYILSLCTSLVVLDEVLHICCRGNTESHIDQIQEFIKLYKSGLCFKINELSSSHFFASKHEKFKDALMKVSKGFGHQTKSQ